MLSESLERATLLRHMVPLIEHLEQEGGVVALPSEPCQSQVAYTRVFGGPRRGVEKRMQWLHPYQLQGSIWCVRGVEGPEKTRTNLSWNLSKQPFRLGAACRILISHRRGSR